MQRPALDGLMRRIGERVLEQDDLLFTAWSVRQNEEALESIFERLADVCLDQLFLDLEFRHTVGELSDDDYLLETAKLISQCRTVGLAPPVTIDKIDLDGDEHRRIGRYEPPSVD